MQLAIFYTGIPLAFSTLGRLVDFVNYAPTWDFGVSAAQGNASAQHLCSRPSFARVLVQAPASFALPLSMIYRRRFPLFPFLAALAGTTTDCIEGTFEPCSEILVVASTNSRGAGALAMTGTTGGGSMPRASR